MLSIQQVDDLHQVFEEHEHQFSESSKDLIVIDACDIIDSSVIVIDACDITGNSVIATIKTITDIRKSQFETFWKNFEKIIERMSHWEQSADFTLSCWVGLTKNC